MMRFALLTGSLVTLLALTGCESPAGRAVYDGPNPFLEQNGGKADTGYVNLRGVELEVTLEADVEAPAWQIRTAPGELAQFAVTHLRNKDTFYLEILAEDTTSPDRVEWRVDGEWLTAGEAANVPVEKLTHFRLRAANAVVVGSAAERVVAGQSFVAKVPRAPLSIMADAGDTCASYNSHIDLSQSVYWYLWEPEHRGCPAELLQDMQVTVERVLPNNPAAYPEYDQLWADQILTAVVVFGKMDDGDVERDYNWRTADRFCEWLTEAGFSEAPNAPLGRRFIKEVGELTEMVDVYYPDLFHSVADYMRIHNWQQAVREHEIVIYNGHSVLGTGYAFEAAEYPGFYQIFQVASCLSYEYYVRPVLAGKGGWDMVDVLSNVEPTYYTEMLPLTGTMLSMLFEGFENGGRVSWQDILAAIRGKLGHTRFGVSGARGNCFTPDGSACDPDPHGNAVRYENHEWVSIPDNDANGATSTIDVPDDLVVTSVSVELELTHTYVGDLEIVLEHAGRSQTVWSRQGGSQDNLTGTFELSGFEGQAAAGVWTLSMVDHAGMDTGQLDRWALVLNEKGGDDPDPQPEPDRYGSDSPVAVPDNDANGATSVINVPDAFAVAGLKVELDISHTYVGDLEIVLQHAGTEVVLRDREGGGADDIRASLDVTGFDGVDAAGGWTLKIIDRANLDSGTLNGWALVFGSDG